MTTDFAALYRRVVEAWPDAVPTKVYDGDTYTLEHCERVKDRFGLGPWGWSTVLGNGHKDGHECGDDSVAQAMCVVHWLTLLSDTGTALYVREGWYGVKDFPYETFVKTYQTPVEALAAWLIANPKEKA